MRIDPELARKMDASLAAYWSSYALTPGSEIRDYPGARFFYTPIPLSLFNGVILTGQDPRAIEAARGSAAAAIAGGGTPVLWRVSPTAGSGTVLADLERAGLQPQGRQPAMLADLSDLPAPPDIAGFSIKATEGAQGRYNWAMLTSEAFGLAPEVWPEMAACEAAFPETEFARQPRYTGYLDGKPVAVSSLVEAADLAGIYAVATLPEARGRGIGTAMTLHAMAEGRKRGAAQAVLQATDMGRPVYEKIGFSVVYDYELYLQT